MDFCKRLKYDYCEFTGTLFIDLGLSPLSKLSIDLIYFLDTKELELFDTDNPQHLDFVRDILMVSHPVSFALMKMVYKQPGEMWRNEPEYLRMIKNVSELLQTRKVKTQIKSIYGYC